MSPQRSAVLPMVREALFLVGAGIAGVGLGIGVAAGIFHGRAPVEATVPQATVMAEVGREHGAARPDHLEMLPSAAQPAAIAPAGTPDPVQNNVAASAPPIAVAGLSHVRAAVPEPHEMLPPVTPLEVIAPAGTPDPVQNDVEASAAPFELAGTGSVVALSDPHQMLSPAPSFEAITPNTPDPVQRDVDAAAPLVEVAGTGSVVAAVPEPRQMLAAITPNMPDPVQHEAEAAAPPPDVAGTESVEAAVTEPGEMLPAATPPVLVSLFRSAPVAEDLKPVMRVVETPNECLVAEICIDDYLWAFYERTPKVDTNKVTERVKALVKKKGKTRIVMKTRTKFVLADFTWKDPIAAQRAGMSLKDYVIGGMDRGFKLKLYYALRAMDEAELMPGITSAFRDNYRQEIASGNKAASDSSYHGGSRRGGYGHGLAADLVSVKGATRMQRFASTVEMWKWIDARENDLGIGRPYLGRDPPHVGPIDGKEFADKRGRARVALVGSVTKRAKLAGSATSRPQPAAAGGNPGVTKPAAKAGPVKVVRVGSL